MVATFAELDDTFLDESATRVAEMIRIATPQIKVVRYVDPNLTPPFWWVFLGRLVLGQKGEEISLQTYGITCRHVVGYPTQGIDGKAQEKAFINVPRVASYLFTHKRLMFFAEDGSLPYPTPPKYLVSAQVAVGEASTFGLFNDGSNQIGIEMEMLLPFSIGLIQEF